MVDDVILNKVAIVERCLARIQEEYAGDERNLRANLTRQDSIILNLQRACEAAIDLAMALVNARRLGLPQESRHAFELLRDAGLLDGELAAHGAPRRLPGLCPACPGDLQGEMKGLGLVFSIPFSSISSSGRARCSDRAGRPQALRQAQTPRGSADVVEILHGTKPGDLPVEEPQIHSTALIGDLLKR